MNYNIVIEGNDVGVSIESPVYEVEMASVGPQGASGVLSQEAIDLSNAVAAQAAAVNTNTIAAANSATAAAASRTNAATAASNAAASAVIAQNAASGVDISNKVDKTDKDATGGFPGLTAFKINFKNALNTFTSYFANANTASRTYTFPNKDITVAGLSDITGTNSGVNTGDETTASIMAKLSAGGSSGVNTGDQTITLSGAVTGTGTGPITTTLVDNVVALGKIVQQATNTFLGRSTAGTGNVEVITATTAKSMLGLDQVNNTSDTNKPVSTLQAAAIAAGVTSANSYTDAKVVGLWDDRGNYDASVNTFPTVGSGASNAIAKGDIWTISVAGTLGGVAVVAKQTVRALVDAAGQTAANWAIGLANTDLEDAINQGVTGRAPTQNIVYLALANKAPLNGVGATGTWGINISGTAAYAATLSTVLPISLGGTGATTAAAALAALGAYPASNPNNYITASQGAVQSVGGFSGVITKAQLGIDQVSNTSDAAKPVSTAQATAIALKANTAYPTLQNVVTLLSGNGSYKKGLTTRDDNILGVLNNANNAWIMTLSDTGAFGTGESIASNYIISYGSIVANANMTAAGTVQGSYLRSTGSVSAASYVYADGGIVFVGNTAGTYMQLRYDGALSQNGAAYSAILTGNNVGTYVDGRDVAIARIPEFRVGALAEVGQYLDMHGAAGNDYDVRLQAASNGTGVLGNLNITCNALNCSGNIGYTSDESLKEDWSDLPEDFLYKFAKTKFGNFKRKINGEHQFGVGANSLRESLPNAIMVNSENGILSVDAGASMGVLVFMANKIIELENRLNAMEAYNDDSK